MRFGKVVSTKAMIDSTRNECKGFGFVDFESESDAETALKTLQSEGMKVQMAKARVEALKRQLLASITFEVGERQLQECDDSNLYISNLPADCDEQCIERILAPFAPIISTRALKNEMGACTGVGFARMESKEKCQKAIDELNGKPLPGCQEPLVVKFAAAGNKVRKKYLEHSIPLSNLNPMARGQQKEMPSNGFSATVAVPVHMPQLRHPPCMPVAPPPATVQHYPQAPTWSYLFNGATGMYEPAYMTIAGLPAAQPCYQMYPSYPAAVDPNVLAFQMNQMHLEQNGSISGQPIGGNYSGGTYGSGQ